MAGIIYVCTSLSTLLHLTIITTVQVSIILYGLTLILEMWAGGIIVFPLSFLLISTQDLSGDSPEIL